MARRNILQGETETLVGCGAFLVGYGIAFTLVATVMGFLFDYNLMTYFGKDAPWYLDVVGGVFCSPIMVPAAVLGLILKACGVNTPIFPG